MRIKQFIQTRAAVLSLAWGLIIFLLCATPGEYIPSSFWLEVLSVDKLVHVSMFFILLQLVLIALAARGKPASLKVLFFLICVLYGLGLEWMQAHLFSNRSADWLDVLANTLGCTLALYFHRRVLRFLSNATS